MENIDPRETILKNLEISQTFVDKEFAEALTGIKYTGDRDTFQVSYDEEGKLILKEWGFLLGREPETFAIDISNVDLAELVSYALEAFKKHRAAGNFDSKLNPSDKISGKDMEKHLDTNIQYLEQMQMEIPQTKTEEAKESSTNAEKQEEPIGNIRYTNINELIEEVENLGDWRDFNQKHKFLKVLSKITVIYNGYELEDENGKTTKEYYPSEVFDAIVKACKGKFPTKEQAFDEKGFLKPGSPYYSKYLVLVNNALSISLMGERTNIDEIAKEEFGIDVYHTPATKEEVDEFVKSSKEYYEEVIKEEKKNAVQVEFHGSLEKVVEYLLEFQKRGESVYVVFNGDKLYSCDVTMDKAFLQVTGITKDEMDGLNRELSEARKGLRRTDIDDETRKEIKAREKEIYDKYEKIEQEHIKEAKEKAVPVEVYLGSLDKVVAYLKECQLNGENVYIDFNGHKLYSVDITMDKAYLEVVGKTKGEYDKEQEEWRREYKEEQERKKAEAEAKIPEWIKKGEEFIYPERMEEWERCVGIRARDLYNGIELDNALALMEKLNSGASMEEVKYMLEKQGHSGASEGLISSIVLHFSKRGPEFYESIADGELSDEERKAIDDIKRENEEIENGTYKDKKAAEDTQREDEETEKKLTREEKEDEFAEEKARAIPVMLNVRKYGNSIDGVIRALEDYRDSGESVVIKFNGHKLYSVDISVDKAYEEVFGKTKEEYDKEIKEWLEQEKEAEARKKAEAEARIPEWIKKGEEFIYPERMEEWKQCVEIRARDIYNGTELDYALEIMEDLENGASIDYVKEIFADQNSSKASAQKTRNIVFNFSKRGPEFYESTSYGELTFEERALIDNKRKENSKLAELHKDDPKKEISPEREQEEAEIAEAFAKKKQLTTEIDDIEQQLAELGVKEAELKKALLEKRRQLKDLEEK